MRKQAMWAVALLCLVGMVLGAGTFTSPATNGKIYGSYKFNVTTTLNATQNCTITGTSTLSGDTATFGWLYNDTAEDNQLNGSLETDVAIDATDWSITGTCYNNTGSSETITAITGVDVDNTVPGCSLGLTQGKEYANDRTWTVTAVNATACTMYFGGYLSGNSYTMTESSDSCTLQRDLPSYASVEVSAQTSDGINTTACSVGWIRISDGSDLEFATALQQQENAGTTSGGGFDTKTIAIALLAVGGLIWWNKNKKKKR